MNNSSAVLETTVAVAHSVVQVLELWLQRCPRAKYAVRPN